MDRCDLVGHCYHEDPNVTAMHAITGATGYHAVCCHCRAEIQAMERPEIPAGHGSYYPLPNLPFPTYLWLTPEEAEQNYLRERELGQGPTS